SCLLSTFHCTSRKFSISLLFSSSSTYLPHLHSFPHDALPISALDNRKALQAQALGQHRAAVFVGIDEQQAGGGPHARENGLPPGDRKSTRLNSSHQIISYAVFCLKKKKTQQNVNSRKGQKPPQ